MTTLGILAVSRHFGLDRSDALTVALRSLTDPESWALKPWSASSEQHLPKSSPKSSAYPSTFRSPTQMPRGSMRTMGSTKLVFTKITTKRLHPKMRGYWRKSSNMDQTNSYPFSGQIVLHEPPPYLCDRPGIWDNTYVHNLWYVYKGEHSSSPTLRDCGDQDKTRLI